MNPRLMSGPVISGSLRLRVIAKKFAIFVISASRKSMMRPFYLVFRRALKPMTRLDWLLLTFGITATILHLSSVGLAMFRCRRQRWTVPAPNLAPGVTILRPICGLDE